MENSTFLKRSGTVCALKSLSKEYGVPRQKWANIPPPRDIMLQHCEFIGNSLVPNPATRTVGYCWSKDTKPLLHCKCVCSFIYNILISLYVYNFTGGDLWTRSSSQERTWWKQI